MEYTIKEMYELNNVLRIIIEHKFGIDNIGLSLNKKVLDPETDNSLSTIMQLGLSYQPIKKFRLDVQLDKSIEQPLNFRLGVEYMATDLISFRTGFSSTSLAALGMGFSWKTITLDIAGQYQQQLGYSGIISIKIMRLKR